MLARRDRRLHAARVYTLTGERASLRGIGSTRSQTAVTHKAACDGCFVQNNLYSGSKWISCALGRFGLEVVLVTALPSKGDPRGRGSF